MQQYSQYWFYTGLKKKDAEVEHEPSVSIFMRKLNSIKLGGFLPLSSLD